MAWRVTSRYSFALTSVSLKLRFSFLYEITGGFLNIFPSNGWFWIKCHLLIKMFLRLVNAGWYLVTKGRMFFRTLTVCWKAVFRSVNLTSETIFSEIVGVAPCPKACFEVGDVLIERFFWGVSSQKSQGFTFYLLWVLFSGGSGKVRGWPGLSLFWVKKEKMSLPGQLPF